MEFNPTNPVVKLCLQGMSLEENNDTEAAGKVFLQAWQQASYDFEKFLAAHYLAQQQKDARDRLNWLETALQFALKIDDDSVRSAFPSLYASIARCHDDLNEPDKAERNEYLATSYSSKLSDKGPFYHGTKADLRVGELLTAGGGSNYKPELTMNHIYFTALVSGAGLAAALARGDGCERVYVVEPTGVFENDPNVTDKKFPGNPTRSYRSEAPLKIIGEVTDWEKQTPEALQKWKEKLATSKGEIIN